MFGVWGLAFRVVVLTSLFRRSLLGVQGLGLPILLGCFWGLRVLCRGLGAPVKGLRGLGCRVSGAVPESWVLKECKVGEVGKNSWRAPPPPPPQHPTEETV